MPNPDFDVDCAQRSHKDLTGVAVDTPVRKQIDGIGVTVDIPAKEQAPTRVVTTEARFFGKSSDEALTAQSLVYAGSVGLGPVAQARTT